jgi:hypothetical protein
MTRRWKGEAELLRRCGPAGPARAQGPRRLVFFDQIDRPAETKHLERDVFIMDRLRQIGPMPLQLFLLSRQLLPLSCEFDKRRPGVLIFRLGRHPLAFPGAIEALLCAVPHAASSDFLPLSLSRGSYATVRHGRPSHPNTNPAES